MLELHGATIAALEFYALSGIGVIVGAEPINYFGSVQPTENIVESAIPASEPIVINSINEPSFLSELAGKANNIEELQQLIKNCKNHLFAKTAGQAVLGIGNIKSDILIIGDMPTADDELSGYAFSDLAGKLLLNMLKSINVDLHEDCFATNLLNWRTPAGSALKADEIKEYLPLIEKIIILQQPKIILSLGSLPVASLTGQTQTINHWRGNQPKHHVATIFTTYHPNILIKNPSFKKNAWADLLALKSRI